MIFVFKDCFQNKKNGFLICQITYPDFFEFFYAFIPCVDRVLCQRNVYVIDIFLKQKKQYCDMIGMNNNIILNIKRTERNFDAS